MPTNNSNYTCVHEEQIIGQSRKIAELEARANFKEKMIDELNHKFNEMDKKIDKINESVNQLLLQSKQDDKDLELRLQAIEKELELQKQNRKDDIQKISLVIAIITVIFVVLTFYFSYLR